MIANRLFSAQARILYILFANLVFAALQNVTVDDAVTSGTVVPAYLPAPSDWNQGNTCSACEVNPDPSYAYDGTWHNGRFHPNSSISLAFEFSFVGGGLYIFFILANTVPNVTTLTNVTFALDGVQVSSFKHSPSTSTDFEYNQAVYANDSIPFGQHTMTVSPVNDSVNSVLILFDYLVYTTETNSGPNIGAIVGGTVGGLAALILVIISTVCYQRHKRRKARQSLSLIAAEPFILPHEMAPTPTGAASSPIQRVLIGSLPDQSDSRHRPTTSALSVTAPSSIAPSITEQSRLSSSGTAAILEQVGMLREELSRLRHIPGQGLNDSEMGSEPPPEYSSQRSTERGKTAPQPQSH